MQEVGNKFSTFSIIRLFSHLLPCVTQNQMVIKINVEMVVVTVNATTIAIFLVLRSIA
jgi:hypothetical protein